jgi:DMSO/TMAO reductase YedYZ molybdopterin-dependent catalytic subunit
MCFVDQSLGDRLDKCVVGRPSDQPPSGGFGEGGPPSPVRFVVSAAERSASTRAARARSRDRHRGCATIRAAALALAPVARTKDPRSMFERLFGNTATDPAIAERIPPGQYRTEKFPVLHYGSVPRVDLATWDFRVFGEVDAPFTLTWEQFKQLPRKQVHTDVHCVTRWSKLDTTWEGVPIQAILEMVQVRPTATHVVSHAEQGYTANLPLEILDDDDVLLADTYDGQPLEPEHGYPLRLLVPKRYFWKSSKWIRGLEFLDHDQLGFWERYGYNNDADPWKEERFSGD